MNTSPGHRRYSLRRLSVWISVAAALALSVVLGVVATVTHSASELAQRGGADVATMRMETLRAVGNLERLIAIGDQFQSETDPARWRSQGVVMQAMVLHPSLSALNASRTVDVNALFGDLSEMLDLREQELDGSLSREALDRLADRRLAVWNVQRRYLKALADDTAATLVQEISQASAEISRGARIVLLFSILGALITVVSVTVLIVLMRRKLLTPLMKISDYLVGMRRGTETDSVLPQVDSQELGLVVDAVGQLANAQRALEHAALYDPLTGLSNRYGLEARLAQAVTHARRQGTQLAVMFIDLDRFKSVNDALGHSVGDRLLRTLAERFGHCLRESDLVARLGGDEFVVVACDLLQASDAAQLAQKLLSVASQPIYCEGRELRLSASIGVCLFPGDGQDVETLMKHADIAMYQAKAAGRANFEFFDRAMNEAVSQRLQIETDIRLALERHEFRLFFQPQMDAAGQSVRAAEALIRWQRADGQMVSPAQFIPIAEESELIGLIGEWVLRTACEYLHEWRQAGLAPVRLAVNLSARQLRDPMLPQMVAGLLELHALDPQLLELEITESAAMSDPALTVSNLRALKALGVSLAIDDFGTGYSSLAYLKMFPIDRLKLDRTFVSDIDSDPNDASICAATVSLAHGLKLELVAEGVENAAQHGFLRELGCDLLQGYLFYRPLPAADFRALLNGRPASAHSDGRFEASA